jgi:hypothetical protein
MGAVKHPAGGAGHFLNERKESGRGVRKRAVAGGN